MAVRTPARVLRHMVMMTALIALIAVAGLLFARSWRPSTARYPVQGIDVSSQQGVIEWKSVRGDGVDFAYLEASEGADLRNLRFAANWRGSAEAGVRRGAYHVFSLCRLARDQATNFIAVVPREANVLPPALDLEFEGNCASRPARGVLIAELAAYIAMIEAHSEKPVILYMTSEFDDFYRISDAIDRPLWLRRSFFAPAYGTRPWVIWQASTVRRVDGIEGPVDWNVVRP